MEHRHEDEEVEALVLSFIPYEWPRHGHRCRSASETNTMEHESPIRLISQRNSPDHAHRKFHRCHSLDETQSWFRSCPTNEATEQSVDVNVEDHVDENVGTVRRVLQRSNSSMSTEVVDSEDRVLENAMTRLREQQERTTHGLMQLYCEQFRLRHQQMLEVLQFLERHQQELHQNQNQAREFMEIRSIFYSIGLELLETIRNVGFLFSLENDDQAGEQEEGLMSGPAFDHIVRLLEHIGQSLTGTDEPFEFESESTAVSPPIMGATERQLKALRIRHINTITRTNVAEDEMIKKCSICMKENVYQGEPQAALTCHHWHCHDCLVQWLRINNSCPICRLSIIKPDSETY